MPYVKSVKAGSKFEELLPVPRSNNCLSMILLLSVAALHRPIMEPNPSPEPTARVLRRCIQSPRWLVRVGHSETLKAMSQAEKLRMSEHRSEIPSKRTARLVDVPNTDFRVFIVQDIRLIGRTRHPKAQRQLRRAGGSITGREDILFDRCPTVSLRVHTILFTRSIGSRMRKEAIAGHIGTVN